MNNNDSGVTVNSNDVANVLVLGNGFDIECGKLTKITDFISFIILFKHVENKLVKLAHCNFLYKYQTYNDYNYNQENNDREFRLTQCADLLYRYYKEDVSGIISVPKRELLNQIDETLNDKFWSPIFRKTLGNVISYGEDFVYTDDTPTSSAYSYFDSLLKAILSKVDFIGEWNELELILRLIITKDQELKEKYDPDNQFVYLDDNNTDIKELEKSIENFEKLFCCYLKIVDCIYDKQTKLDEKLFFNNINQQYHFSVRARSNLFIEDFDISKASVIYSYNYTSTLNLFKCWNSNNLNSRVKIFYINGNKDRSEEADKERTGFWESLELENQLLLGISEEGLNENDPALIFTKKYRRIIKNTNFINQENFLNNYKKFNLIIYGHSCGITDSDSIKNLLISDNLNVALILCYDKNSFENTVNNLMRILSPKVFYHKVIYSRKIFFGIRESNYENNRLTPLVEEIDFLKLNYGHSLE